MNNDYRIEIGIDSNSHQKQKSLTTEYYLRSTENGVMKPLVGRKLQN